MSADIFDDISWANDVFAEWASVNIPTGNREAVVKLWREIGRGWMWATLCKEEAAMHGKEISFTFEKTEEEIREEKEWYAGTDELVSQMSDDDVATEEDPCTST